MISHETRIYLLRGGRAHFKHGDPYEWSATAVIVDGVAEIIGLSGKQFTAQDRDDIIEWCRRQGYSRLIYDREVDGEFERFTVSL